MEVEVIVRKWGNSVGITLPKKIVEAEQIQENDKIIISIKKKTDIKSIMGICKNWNKSSQSIKNEMRKGWD